MADLLYTTISTTKRTKARRVSGSGVESLPDETEPGWVLKFSPKFTEEDWAQYREGVDATYDRERQQYDIERCKELILRINPNAVFVHQ